MNQLFDIALDPSRPPQHSRTTARMPRRNAIVRHKRGRTNKSEDLRQDFEVSADNCNVAPHESLSGSVTATGFLPEVAELEEQRRNKSTVHHHEDLMPLKDLAFLLSTYVTLIQSKGQIGSDVTTTGYVERSEKERHTCAASEA